MRTRSRTQAVIRKLHIVRINTPDSETVDCSVFCGLAWDRSCVALGEGSNTTALSSCLRAPVRVAQASLTVMSLILHIPSVINCAASQLFSPSVEFKSQHDKNPLTPVGAHSHTSPAGPARVCYRSPATREMQTGGNCDASAADSNSNSRCHRLEIHNQTLLS